MIKVKDCAACSGCPFQRLFPENNLVPPLMGPSKRLVVAEAPGETEAEVGEPLVGSSGRIFDSLCRKAGIHRDQISIVNTINCRPPNNIYPTDAKAREYCTQQEAADTLSHCYREHVKPLLDSRKWERIDALGAKALQVLTGKTDITKWRGSPLPLIGSLEPIVMPTLHPAFVMRCQEYMPLVISDLTKGLAVPPEHYNLTPTFEELAAWNPRRAAVDIETNMFTGQITMVGISDKLYHTTVIPFKGAYIEQAKRILGGLEEFIGQNCIQFDIPVLEKHGVKFRDGLQVWDIMLMFHLLHPDSPGNDLETISSIYTQKPAWKHLNNEDMALYNARDTDVTFQAFLQLKPLLRMYNLEDLYCYTQVPLAKICGQMTSVGIRTDANRVKYVKEKLELEKRELEQLLPPTLRPYDKKIRIRKPAPEGTLGKSGKPIKFIHVEGTEPVVPWASPKQVEVYLYETLKLQKQLHPKTNKVTTDKNALEKLFRKTKNPVIQTIQRLRQLEELLTTFLKEKTVGVGRVHSNFLVHGTNTGRLASSGPNLQNLNPTAKYIYVPSHEGWCFVEADFSSLENRLAAHYANDTDRLMRMSIPGFNEHRWLASKIFGIPENEISKDSEEYGKAKHTNHGADAGMGPRKMYMQYNIPIKDCEKCLLMWKTLNHKSVEWQELTGNTAINKGILTTAFNRKRWFWTTSAYTDGIRFMTQSTGADICFRSMIGLCYERINWPRELAIKVAPIVVPLPWPARLLVQVHDSLLIECPQDKVHEVIQAMYKVMTQPWAELGGFSIPVAFKVGKPNNSWAELEAIKLEEYLK